MERPDESAVVSVEVLPKDGITLDDRATRINNARAALGASLNQAGNWAIILGMELQSANAALGERRGAHNSKSATVALFTFPQWLKANCPDVSERSADRYMQLARGAKAHFLKTGEEAIRALLAKPATELNNEEREALHNTIHKVTDGKTYEQLALDFNLKGGKGKKTGKGTGDNGQKTKDANNEPPIGWSPEEWDLYQAGDDQEKTAIDLWRPIETGITAELTTQTLAHLPELFLKNLEHAAAALDNRIAEIRKAAAKKGARK